MESQAPCYCKRALKPKYSHRSNTYFAQNAKIFALNTHILFVQRHSQTHMR